MHRFKNRPRLPGVLLVCLLLAGAGWHCTPGAPPEQVPDAQRQTGRLIEQAAPTTPPLDPEEEKPSLADEEDINQRIMTLPESSPPTDRALEGITPEVVALAPLTMDRAIDPSTITRVTPADPANLGGVETFTVIESLPETLSQSPSLQIRITGNAALAGTSERVFVEYVVDDQGRIRRPKITQGADTPCAKMVLSFLQDVKLTPKSKPLTPASRQPGQVQRAPATCIYQ